MTDVKYIIYSLLWGMVLVSCSSDDAVSDDASLQQVAREVDLLISVDNKAYSARQTSGGTRSADTFTGMDGLLVIPFHTDGAAVAPDDMPLIDVAGVTENNRVEEHNSYYVNHCFFMPGTDRVLAYGKAEATSTDLTVNGRLSALPTIRTTLDKIKFSLSSIRSTTEVHEDAAALAQYMTDIANSEGWSTSEDVELKRYYNEITRTNTEGGGLMSGSAANIKAFVKVLKERLADRDDAVSTAIKANIDNNSSIAAKTYPRSIGLPDGAAVMRWTGSAFSVRTTTTTLDNINGIDRYTYPAELMFFTDSPIRTSTTAVPLSTYENASVSTSWEDFIETNYKSSRTVNTNTRAVAVENPLQYGVAKLQLTLTGMSAELRDAKDVIVEGANMTTLPLTGVIIGGQHTVGYNMKPQGEQTDVDGRFIYETHISTGSAGKSISTLVLQSYDEEKVPVILEFENNTGKYFTGKDGVVYPGMRFYLIGIVDPKGKGTGAYEGRVFTQDYTTTMTMSVSSLAHAYTCMPDLLQPRLEVGVQIVTKWIQVTTTNVEL